MNWEDLLKNQYKYRMYDDIGLKHLYNSLRNGPWTKEVLEDMEEIKEELKRRGVWKRW
tara:strand:+ start:45 stop:218 length:174 start_codon:yes stop_codon:yes gene_type:complete